jgi:hypothetical protein
MTDVSTPITQDLVTIPRKLPEGPLNLVGLTREALREALVAAGTPEKQAKMRTGQLWHRRRRRPHAAAWTAAWTTRGSLDRVHH